MHDKWRRIFDQSQRIWKGLTPRQRDSLVEYRKALQALRIEDYDLYYLLDPYGKDKPRRVLQADIDWPTNRTTGFHEGDLTLVFDRSERTVTYSVSENNHAREHAASTCLDQTFRTQIRKVRWTHGTGGVVLGNDEYNRESGYEHEGGGGSYIVDAYGYIGAKEAPAHVGEFLNGKGQRVHVEVKSGRNGFVGKVVAGPAARSTYGIVR
jgi:hypothetical protein